MCHSVLYSQFHFHDCITRLYSSFLHHENHRALHTQKSLILIPVYNAVITRGDIIRHRLQKHTCIPETQNNKWQTRTTFPSTGQYEWEAHLWLAAARHTSMMAFLQIFWACKASWSSLHMELRERAVKGKWKIETHRIHAHTQTLTTVMRQGCWRWSPLWCSAESDCRIHPHSHWQEDRPLRDTAPLRPHRHTLSSPSLHPHPPHCLHPLPSPPTAFEEGILNSVTNSSFKSICEGNARGLWVDEV